MVLVTLSSLWNVLAHFNYKQTRSKFQFKRPPAEIRNLINDLGSLLIGSKCHQTPFSSVVLTVHKIERLTLLSSRVPKERGDLLSY